MTNQCPAFVRKGLYREKGLLARSLKMYHRKMVIVIEILGWLGTLAILLAYTLASLGKITPQKKTYQYLNLFGGLGIAVVSIYKQAYQPALLNIIWSTVALIALIKAFLAQIKD